MACPTGGRVCGAPDGLQRGAGWAGPACSLRLPRPWRCRAGTGQLVEAGRMQARHVARQPGGPAVVAADRVEGDETAQQLPAAQLAFVLDLGAAVAHQLLEVLRQLPVEFTVADD